MMEKKKQTNFTLSGIFMVVVTGVICFSIFSMFNSYSRHLELLSHFRMQYLFASILCLAGLLICKKIKTSAIILVIVILNVAHILPWYLKTDIPIAPATAIPLKIMLSNVHSSNQNYDRLLSLIKTESPDIFIAQEVNQRWISKIASLEKEYHHKLLIPREDNFGIALYSKLPLSKVKKEFYDSDVPSIYARLKHDGHEFTLIATHPLPPINKQYFDARNTQLNALATGIKSINEPIILIGDLNVTLWSGNYKTLETNSNLYNARKGFGIIPTWPSHIPLMRIPIDHCLLSNEFSVTNIKTGPDIGSDHLPLIIEIKMNTLPN
ncbi:MAG: endonuclease/exonuclease/phosphatase family protein [Phycisphaerae bacterium]|nr:endonuclease/exonuclease/phosphatase family protein [Phycisphaerae bacterium]